MGNRNRIKGSKGYVSTKGDGRRATRRGQGREKEGKEGMKEGFKGRGSSQSQPQP